MIGISISSSLGSVIAPRTVAVSSSIVTQTGAIIVTQTGAEIVTQGT